MKAGSITLFTTLLAGAFLTGCGGPRGHGGPGGAEAYVEPVYLCASQPFLSGKILATVIVSNQRTPHFGPDDRTKSGGESGGRGMPGGMGGGMGGRGGGMGGPGGGMGGGPGDEGGGGAERPQGRMMRESSMPPLSVTLELANISDKPLKVQVWELNSELGNFAVRPDVFTLQPGTKAGPNAMTSRLGLSTSSLPVTLVLRAEGDEDKQVLVLKPTPPPE